MRFVTVPGGISPTTNCPITRVQCASLATYKCPDLLLHDPARLVNVLTNRERPVQLVLAGKAHPQDAEGQ